MKISYLILGCICIILLAVMPAQAFTAKALTITLNGNGDATMDMQYYLTFAERAAIFVHAVDPATELQNVLQENFNGPITVVSTDTSSAEVIIPSFASVTTTGGATTMTTPSLSFERAQQIMQQLWYSALLSPDLTPQVTTITFPDGYQVSYTDQISIPSVSHTLS